MQTYRELIAWQRARVLVKAIYELTKLFPAEERFGLTSQMRRAVVSICSNLAEGWRRGTADEWHRFLRYAYGSASELETQLVLALDIGLISNQQMYESCTVLTDEVCRLLTGLIKSSNSRKLK